MTARLAFDVAGLPVPQGNLRAGLIAGRARLIHSGPKFGPLHAWREAIATEARRAIEWEQLGGGRPGPVVMLGNSVEVRATFRLPRPLGHSGARGLRPSAPAFPGRKPDLDKLGRALLDALTGVVFLDDAQVVDLIVRKRYADPGQQPGVAVEISERLP